MDKGSNNRYYRIKDFYEKYATLKNKNKDDFNLKTNSKFITYKNVFENTFIIDNLNFGNVWIDENEKQNYTNFGDLIFTASSETLQDIATSSIVLTDKKLLVNSFCQAYKLKDKSNININIKYLGYYLRTNLFRKYIIRYGSGYTRFNIRKDYILNAPLYLPPFQPNKK